MWRSAQHLAFRPTCLYKVIYSSTVYVYIQLLVFICNEISTLLGNVIHVLKCYPEQNFDLLAKKNYILILASLETFHLNLTFKSYTCIY